MIASIGRPTAAGSTWAANPVITPRARSSRTRSRQVEGATPTFPAILIGAGLALYAGWGGGTAIGVVAGDSLADPATLGLDAAFPAGMAVFLKAPLLLVIVVAAVTAGLLRAIG
jgi:predicted branched-subunit amino acid permease